MTTDIIYDKIVALTGHSSTDLEDLLEQFENAARRDGAEGVVIDLEDAGEMTDSAREFLDANNGIRVRR